MSTIIFYWDQWYVWSSSQPFYIQLFLAIGGLVSCCLLIGAIVFGINKTFSKSAE